MIFSVQKQMFLQKLSERVALHLGRQKEHALKVDLFLSHSWSCPNWKKLLAMCHFLNLDLAIISSITASTMAVVFLVSWRFEQKALKSRFWFAVKKRWLVYRVKVRPTLQVVDCCTRPVTKTRIWVLPMLTICFNIIPNCIKIFHPDEPLEQHSGLIPRDSHVSNLAIGIFSVYRGF